MKMKVSRGTQIAGPPPGGAPEDVLLPITYVTQQPYVELCWAACGVMVLNYSHVGPLQLCDVTSRTFNRDCCSSPGSCDASAWPQNMYSAFGFFCQTIGSAMSPQSVQSWISGLYPVQVYLVWQDNEGSHTVLIVGYFSNGELMIFDPQWGTGRQTYAYLLGAYGHGSWQGTWYNIVEAANA